MVAPLSETHLASLIICLVSSVHVFVFSVFFVICLRPTALGLATHLLQMSPHPLRAVLCAALAVTAWGFGSMPGDGRLPTAIAGCLDDDAKIAVDSQGTIATCVAGLAMQTGGVCSQDMFTTNCGQPECAPVGWFVGTCPITCGLSPTCAFTPCKDAADFVPTNLLDAPHCVGDEQETGNPIAANQAACEAAGCDWSEGDDPCTCNTPEACEAAGGGANWTPRSFKCGSAAVQDFVSRQTCATDSSTITWTAGMCCRGGTASSKC